MWRRGSVVASWLLDLTAAALRRGPRAGGFDGRVSDSGEGRWTALAAIDEGVPAPRAHHRAVRALQLAGRGRLRRQGALGHAQGVRRPRREAGGRASRRRARRRAPTPTHRPARSPVEAVESTPGRRAYAATFLPELGMLGASLRRDGARVPRASTAALDGYGHGHTTGLPLLAPWANRLGAGRLQRRGRSVDLDRRRRAAPDANGLPIHGTMTAAAGWESWRTSPTPAERCCRPASTSAPEPDLLASFPFPHDLTVVVAESTTVGAASRPPSRHRRPRGARVASAGTRTSACPASPQRDLAVVLPGLRAPRARRPQLPTGVSHGRRGRGGAARRPHLRRPYALDDATDRSSCSRAAATPCARAVRRGLPLRPGATHRRAELRRASSP